METKCGLHGLLALGDILTKVVISPLSAETRLQACTLPAEVSRPALKVCFLRSLPSGQQSEDQTRQIYISRSCYLIQIQVSRSESVFFSFSSLSDGTSVQHLAGDHVPRRQQWSRGGPDSPTFTPTFSRFAPQNSKLSVSESSCRRHVSVHPPPPPPSTTIPTPPPSSLIIQVHLFAVNPRR